MKYRLILLLLLASCVNYSTSTEKKSGYSSTGFVYIERNNLSDQTNDAFFVSHNKLRAGTKIRVINPNNNKSLEVVIKKKLNTIIFTKL